MFVNSPKVEFTDEQLVQKSLEEIHFFGNLVERYEQKLKFYILRISSFSEMEAEEILQEVFLKAWKNLNGFDTSLKFSTWIYQIAHNETISAFRKFKSRGEDKRAQLDPEIFDTLPDNIDFVHDFDYRLQTQKIKEILELLPENYREILILKYFEDKSYDEISDILQKPGGTVATLLNRAKKQFKEIYERKSESRLNGF